MKLQDVLERVESSKVYDYWKKENASSYLCSFFKIEEEEDKDWWQIDFYNPKHDTITSFVTEKEVHLAGKDSKIFKKENKVVDPLHLDEVTIDVTKAIAIAKKLLTDKYKGEIATKKIIILQHVISTIWNISFITGGLKLINIKIDATSGDIVEDSIKNILDFKDQSE